MATFDLEQLRPKLDLENKYVDFSSIRAAVSVYSLVRSLVLNIVEPNKEGEGRADCPKCKKTRSFAFNINNNRFNCFNKGCAFKGGGVIDFISKLFDVTAKEASHLVACAYGIQPYSADESGDRQSTSSGAVKKSNELGGEKPPIDENEFVPRGEFEKLKANFDRFRNVVYGFMLENDEHTFDGELIETFEKANQIQ